MKTEKTAKEWFEQLPEPIRTQAIEAWEKSDWNTKNYLCESLVDALNNWEWDDYWGDVFNRFVKGEFDTPNLHGWIPVGERLPEHNEQVLVIGDLDTDLTEGGETENNKVGLVAWSSVDLSPCVDTCCYSMWYSNIQFWQPLPKLPEVRNETN